MKTVDPHDFERLNVAYRHIKRKYEAAEAENRELRGIIEEIRLQLDQAREFRCDRSANG